MVMESGGERFDDAAARVLGPVFDRVIEGVDIYAAGVDDVVMEEVTVTVREAAAVAGWVGVVDADLTMFADLKLELRLPGETSPCIVIFRVGPKVLGQTLIRGTGPAPSGSSSPRVRSRPRVTPVPRELAEDLLRGV